MIYLTQQWRMFIQKQGENRREDEVPIDASYVAFMAMASLAAALEFLCKEGCIQVHCQVQNKQFKPFFDENQQPEVQWRWMSGQSDWKVD